MGIFGPGCTDMGPPFPLPRAALIWALRWYSVEPTSMSPVDAQTAHILVTVIWMLTPLCSARDMQQAPKENWCLENKSQSSPYP